MSCRGVRGGAEGRRDDAEKNQFEQEILDQFETQGHPYYASARLWDDGIIDPLDTRKVVGLGLETAANAPIEDTQWGVFRM